MKKSLIIRWSIIAVVILVWIFAIFPVRDSNYLKMFDKLSASNVAKIQKEAQALLEKGNPREIADKMAATEDKNSQEYKDLAASLEALRKDPAFPSWVSSTEYEELTKRLNLIQLKADYELAENIRQQMDSMPDKTIQEYKTLEQQYQAITGAEGYKKWTETLEYRELVRRLPVYRLREALEASNDKGSAQYKADSDELRKLEAELTVKPEFKDKAEEAEYEAVVNKLTLVYDVDKSISGFKMLEKAANGNSNLYRISLNDFIKVPFHGACSNKLILRYVRLKSAGKLRLGLDLKGGTEFVLDFNIKEAQGLMVTDKVMQDFVTSVLDETNEAAAGKLPAELSSAIKAFAGELKAADSTLSNKDIAGSAVRKKEISESLRTFLAANLSLVKKADTASYNSVTEIRDRIHSILDNRLNSMGVTEPEIKPSGENTISVRMPSVDEADKNEIRNTIRKTAKLEFYLVSKDSGNLVQQYEQNKQAFKTPAGVIRTEIEDERTDGSVSYTTVFLEEKPTPVKGEDIERAFATTDEYGKWIISLKFNARGTVAFREVTGKNVGRLLAIVLDGKVYSAPVLKTEISNGQAVIQGRFTLEEAKRLASVIASGNVPVTVNIGSEFGTDPTLGSDSISKGVVAGIWGLLTVVLFMLYYYRVAGVVAICALVVNTILVLGTMAITRATITMPGIAGMILTIGMAVDANVIIFERIREELRGNSTIANAIVAGYSKAFSSIFDSNLTTLVTAFFLYKFGTGSIKGFAVTLSFGIFASMFTAIFMTKAIFDLLVANDMIKSLKMASFKFLENLKLDFLKYRKLSVRISVFFVVISLAAFITKGRNMLGIDFSGGTEMAYECQGQRPDVEKIRNFLKTQDYSDNVRVGYKRGQSGDPLLEIVLPIEKKDGQEKAIDYTEFNRKLDEAFPEVKISLKQTNTVGANVGSQFRWAAMLAASFSILGIIVYLAFRFELMYGIAATIAVVHDAIVSAGLFVLCGGHISLTVVAAIMTIMGYSLNDTIVIFDRIRETKDAEKGLSYKELINKAVNECMSRTILTSLTTMLVVIFLLVFGGGAVFDFALVMFFGIITGTYSTIFIASTFINTWHKRSVRSARQELKLKQAEARAKKAVKA